MRTLVTGGAGFIGSTLVDRLLADGHEVAVIDNLSSGSRSNLLDAVGRGADFSFCELDLRDGALSSVVDSIAPEVIFHLAAQSSVAVSVEDPGLDTEVNVLGGVRLLEAARRAGTRKVVFAASGGTLYGSPGRDELPVREDHPQAPSSPYGIAKRAMLDYLAAYRELFGLDYTALALANVYGPRQDPHGEAGVVAIFAERLLGDEPLTIYGDGLQTRDFVFVDDVVDAFVRAAAADVAGGAVLNIGTGTETSVNELFEVLNELAGGERAVEHVPARPGEVRHSALDPRRALQVLGWAATTSLEAGLAAVLEARRSASSRRQASAA